MNESELIRNLDRLLDKQGGVVFPDNKMLRIRITKQESQPHEEKKEILDLSRPELYGSSKNK